jgi:DNA invertase Pin-like site-specific DNA recombinase
MKRTTNTKASAAKAASDERSTGPRVRCAIYTRKSTDENLDNDFNSLDAQRESAEMYIRSQSSEGWQALPNRYDDGAYSGATLERPALQRLLADVEAGRVDTIVVYKIDRFSRSLLDFTKLIERLEAHHVSLVSVTQQFNTTTSMGRLTLNILLSFAQFERELSAERIRDKIGAARRRGKYIGGVPPLGYSVDHERKRLVVDPVEAALVRTIFSRYRELGSIVALVRELNGKGVRTKSWTKRDGTARDGVPWHKGNMVKLLHNPIYIGLVRHHDQTYPGEQEAIIDQSLWNDVQAALAGNSRQRDDAARGRQPALLKGLLRCGHCDAPMGLTFTRGDGRTYRYYTCHRTANQSATDCPVRSLPARVVEGAAIEQLREVFRAPQVVTETMRLADAGPVVGALASLEPIWENLFPAEQERLVLLLVEKMVVYPDHLEMVLSREGLRALVAEMDEEGGGHAPVHCVA